MEYTINKLEEENAKLKDIEKMTLSLSKLEMQFKDGNKERDKALQELARLKQHLLEKELEDSYKMDEDSKMIEDLQANSEQLRACVLQLEKTLKQEIVGEEEFEKLKNDELHKSYEVIDDLNKNLQIV